MNFEIKEDDLKEALASANITVLDFYADWCAPCKVYSPIITEFGNLNDDVSVCKVNLDDNPGLVKLYGIRSIPTTVILDKGQLITKFPGVTQITKLNEFVEPLR